MRKIILASAVGTLLACFAGANASAAIFNQSENFSDGGVGTLSGNSPVLVAAGYTWAPGGTAGNPGGWGNNAEGSGGADGQQGNDDPDGGVTSDGANDGGIFVDGGDLGETVSFAFAGTIADGGVYTFDIALFQSSSSFVTGDVELLADGVVVDSAAQGGINGSVASGNPSKLVQLTYTGTAATDGQTLSFLVRQTRASNNSMDLGIDNWSLTSTDIPEPGTMVLTLLGLCGLGFRRR